MIRYAINVQGRPWSDRVMVEYMLYGAAMAAKYCGAVVKLELCGYVPHWISFKTNSPAFVSALKMELSNYGLAVEEQP